MKNMVTFEEILRYVKMKKFHNSNDTTSLETKVEIAIGEYFEIKQFVDDLLNSDLSDKKIKAVRDKYNKFLESLNMKTESDKKINEQKQPIPIKSNNKYNHSKENEMMDFPKELPLENKDLPNEDKDELNKKIAIADATTERNYDKPDYNNNLINADKYLQEKPIITSSHEIIDNVKNDNSDNDLKVNIELNDNKGFDVSDLSSNEPTIDIAPEQRINNNTTSSQFEDINELSVDSNEEQNSIIENDQINSEMPENNFDSDILVNKLDADLPEIEISEEQRLNQSDNNNEDDHIIHDTSKDNLNIEVPNLEIPTETVLPEFDVNIEDEKNNTEVSEIELSNDIPSVDISKDEPSMNNNNADLELMMDDTTSNLSNESTLSNDPMLNGYENSKTTNKVYTLNPTSAYGNNNNKGFTGTILLLVLCAISGLIIFVSSFLS